MTSPYIQQAVARCKLPVSVVMHDDFGTLCYGIYTPTSSWYRYGATHATSAYLAALQAYRVAEDDRGGLGQLSDVTV